MDGFTRDVDLRSAKRRRVEMTGPEGFLESAGAPPKPAHKPTVPQFNPAFGEVEITVKPKSKAKEAATVKHVMKKSLSRRMPQDTSTSRDTMKAGTSRRVDTETAPKPPKIVSVHDIHKEFAIDALSKSKPQLHPAPPPPALVNTSAPKAPLRQIVVPVFQAKPSKALQPIQPLANPILPTSRHHLQAGKDLRTLSTTGLGMLTDLSSENGAEDLASILLRDQNKELYAHMRDDATRRGLELSPEKKGKDGAGKFVRGGLAARAASQFDRKRTAFILWRRQKELELSRANTIPSGAEFSASVLKIMHRSPAPPARPSTSTSPTTVIAVCRIYRPNGDTHPLFKADQLYKIVFSCPDARTSSTELGGLREGQVVRVYKPWQEMHASEEKVDGTSVHAPRLPASLPLPCSAPYSTPDPLNAPMSDTTLFCSRYFIS